MRCGESVWFCKREIEKNSTIEKFKTPQEIKTRLNYFSIQPTSGYMDLMSFGEKVSEYQRIIAQPYQTWKDFFHAGDKFYVDVKPTDDDLKDEYASRADYVVDAVFNQNRCVRVIIKRLQTGE